MRLRFAKTAGGALLCIAGGCSAVGPSSNVSSGSLAAHQAASGPMALSDGWFAGERLVTKPGGDAALPLDISRQGSTPEGYQYHIFTDGSGGLNAGTVNWSLDCTKDKITDRRECTMHPWVSDTKLFITFNTAGDPHTVCIFGHDFPGRVGAIRVDSQAPISTDTEGCVSPGRVLAELRSGSTVTTRFVKWPYDYPRDSVGSLEGFNRATELAKFITLNIDELKFSS